MQVGHKRRRFNNTSYGWRRLRYHIRNPDYRKPIITNNRITGRRTSFRRLRMAQRRNRIIKGRRYQAIGRATRYRYLQRNKNIPSDILRNIRSFY